MKSVDLVAGRLVPKHNVGPEPQACRPGRPERRLAIPPELPGEKGDRETSAPPDEEFPVAKVDAKDGKEKPLTVEEAEKIAEEAAKAYEAGDGSNRHTMKVNMMHMIEKGDLSQNVLLKPGDVVYVPPNPLAAFGLAMQQVLLWIQPTTSMIQLPASALYSVKSVQTFGTSSSKQIP